MDHPRSRGVYHGRPSTGPRAGGSSPLARGLLSVALRPVCGARIIPARAGFTVKCLFMIAHSPDHPRSRGVYRPRRLSRRTRAGSSPLARGLRTYPRLRAGARRIIPARAGFTRWGRRRRGGGRDHPRSRGVYIVDRRPYSGGPGSSPLARGLRHRARRPAPGEGIIPARAGFTGSPGTRPPPWPDHPRSRGVYLDDDGSPAVEAGSSPLARGLLPGSAQSRQGRRIIPARAGFTRGPPTPTRWAPDHPRSRGVYRRECFERRFAGGSSPLARGLHGEWRPDSRGARIIPARAGFTSCARS